MGERRFSTKNRFVSFLLAIAMVLTLLPIGAVQAKAEGSRQIIMHFKNSTNWEAVYTKIAEGDSWTAVDGYGYANSWPGAEVEKDSANEGWYSFTISTNSEKEFHCIFNNKGNGKQTGNIGFTANGSKVEKWVTGEQEETVIEDQAPEGWKESTSSAPVKPVIKVQSPVVHEDRTVTFNLDATGEYKDAEDVRLMGTVAGTNWDNGLSMKKEGDKFTVTVQKQNPGIYGYKYKIGTSWITDPANDAMTDGNSRLVVPGLESKNMEALAGKDLELPKTLKLYGDDGTSSDETVSYTLKDPSLSDKVTLKDETINVKKGSGIKTVDLIATAGNEKSDVTVNVVQKQYKVTINMYSPDFEMKSGVSDVYIYNKNGAEKEFVPLNNTIEDTENNVTWLQGTTYVSFNSLGIIGRPTAGSWDGQDSNQYYVINEEKSEITLWYVFGKKPVIEKPVITKADPRYLCLEYENDTLTTTPEFYSWTTGIEEKVRKPFESDGNGKWKIKDPVKSTCTKVDFVVVLDPSGSDWIKDGGDHSIAFPQEQNVVCASMKKGEEPVLSAPYNKGYEVLPKENKIAFYYRDDNALIDDKLADMKVSVDINGTEYEMTYNAGNKRFEYNYNKLESGCTYYRYKVGDEYILDKYNDKQEQKEGNDYSYIEYYKLNATIQAEVMNASFNYNENNVVKFTVNQDENDTKKMEVASASIDISSLGGSSTLAIVPDLQAVTISATTDTSLGKKTLPIVVTDQYGNEYSTSVHVDVTARTRNNPKDFDCDEAVIYFMVTDRFFDGNESNNTASGAKTYGKDNAGLYHGGDFAGITQKLDYLEDLGINTIWITPIVENIPGVTVTDTGKEDVPYNAAYHGYWASDFTKLNPTLGTEEEFQTLIDQAHSRGIRIMVDIVVNHAGYDTEFGNMIRSGDDVVSGSDQKDSLSNLPDFRTEDPAVSAQLVEWQTQWVKDCGIDYIRVDTVKHVENDTWAELKNALTKTDPNFKMIGEYAGGGYASNGNTLGTGEMDSDLDFDFNDQAANFVKGNISSVENFLASRNSALNNTYMTGQFLGSHDEDGFKQKLLDGGLKEDAATAASMVAASLQITAKGQPVVYYGEEIGLTGLNNYPYQTNRYDFDWSMVNNDNKTYQHYKKMLSIRNAYTDVFARGDRKTIVASDEKGYDIVSRSYQGTKLYVGLNIKGAAQTVEVPVSESNGTILKDLYSGTSYTVNNGKVEVTIPAAADGGTVVLKKNSSGGSSSSRGSTTTETKPSEDIKKDTTTETTVPSEKLPAGTKATVTVTKSGDGKVTAEAAVEAAGKTTKTGVKATVNADVIKAVTEAAGTKDVIITQEVKKADGTTAYT